MTDTERDAEVLAKGEYYTTITDGDYFVDVYKHAKANYLYVVDIEGINERLTTVVQKQCYRKELDRLFFVPLANALWDEHNILKAIKRDRICA